MDPPSQTLLKEVPSLWWIITILVGPDPLVSVFMQVICQNVSDRTPTDTHGRQVLLTPHSPAHGPI